MRVAKRFAVFLRTIAVNINGQWFVKVDSKIICSSLGDGARSQKCSTFSGARSSSLSVPLIYLSPDETDVVPDSPFIAPPN